LKKFINRLTKGRVFSTLEKNKQYSLVIGRFQPLHVGHIRLIRSILDEGKNVCIALKDTAMDENNIYSAKERLVMFKDVFAYDIEIGTLRVIVIPDIDEVCYGRTVGWGMRRIQLDAETEKISATEIRNARGIYER